MKTRNGFVSNSSSSSFVIKKDKLTSVQIEQIKNYQKEAYRLGEYNKIVPDKYFDAFGIVVCGTSGKFGCIDDRWEIKESIMEIRGDTYLDNFDFEAFFKEIGVKDKDIEWDKDRRY